MNESSYRISFTKGHVDFIRVACYAHGASFLSDLNKVINETHRWSRDRKFKSLRKKEKCEKILKALSVGKISKDFVYSEDNKPEYIFVRMDRFNEVCSIRTLRSMFTTLSRNSLFDNIDFEVCEDFGTCLKIPLNIPNSKLFLLLNFARDFNERRSRGLLIAECFKVLGDRVILDYLLPTWMMVHSFETRENETVPAETAHRLQAIIGRFVDPAVLRSLEASNASKVYSSTVVDMADSFFTKGAMVGCDSFWTEVFNSGANDTKDEWSFSHLFSQPIEEFPKLLIDFISG